MPLTVLWVFGPAYTMAEEHVQHVPVLLAEVAAWLDVIPGNVVLDCTVGLGGHAGKLAEAAGKTGLLIGIDVDEGNLQVASQRVEGRGCPVRLFRCNFSRFEEALAEAGVDQVDVILADLGVSSSQLADPHRGFSFLQDGPLDMRMDNRLPQTAADLVNHLGERELADLIYRYGQDRFSRRIARAIHEARRRERIKSTAELARIIARAVGIDPRSRKSKIHPATRCFQSLRVAVNDELTALQHLLDKAPGYLRCGGKIGVISFHSLEDALVKRDFARRKTKGLYEILTKKPVTAGQEELKRNPRARSAKLRVARRKDAPAPAGAPIGDIGRG